ncbi:MAG: 5-formyltetrahydrofolate cyclo-ligase [Candidatus Sumerlaeota bacterium]|nr:5-formyltetrahydrofolate cyclo-ligase [Candidatus Sumerlaeota bacterium]
MVTEGNSLKENHDDEKARLRADFQAQRRALDPAEWARMSGAITRSALTEPALGPAGAVFAYVSKGREADTHALISELWRQGKIIITPSNSGRGAAPDKFVMRGAAGGDERSAGIGEIRRMVDVVIVPGLAWDGQGYRIGYGGGYFDRVLACLNPDALKIGLAFEFQVVGRLPVDPWDVPVDVVITESRRIMAGCGG